MNYTTLWYNLAKRLSFQLGNTLALYGFWYASEHPPLSGLNTWWQTARQICSQPEPLWCVENPESVSAGRPQASARRRPISTSTVRTIIFLPNLLIADNDLKLVTVYKNLKNHQRTAEVPREGQLYLAESLKTSRRNGFVNSRKGSRLDTFDGTPSA